MTRVFVGRAEDFDDGEKMLVEEGDREVCVIRSDGEFYALGNRCPHRMGPLNKGEVSPEITEDTENAPTGQKPELTFADNEVIVCPWHGWEYDLETGEHAGDPNYGVPTYDILVEDGEVYLEL